ncbi:hypothetical protein B0H13DRAFT_1857598 [Mycena leptocephala]|nr:hypothetical protein B0H13DRAFT_1857598 [Mycena leptocephala]
MDNNLPQPSKAAPPPVSIELGICVGHFMIGLQIVSDPLIGGPDTPQVREQFKKDWGNGDRVGEWRCGGVQGVREDLREDCGVTESEESSNAAGCGYSVVVREFSIESLESGI